MPSSSESSDSDSEHKKPKVSRLGNCEVCASTEAIYTCPKCEVKTCCLSCVTIHKKELECDGLRDRTKFIRMKDFTDTDLLSDYRLLEESARFIYGVKRNEKKSFTRIDKDLPLHLYKLKMAARKRGTVLQFLAQNFTRHKCNTTRYHYKSNIISWRIEWIFPSVDSEPLKFVDEKCPENKKLSEFLDKYLNPDAMPFEGSKALTYYKAAGFSGVKILLKAEKVKGSAKKFFELDPTDTLAENLTGKCVVEFPIVFVVMKDHAYNFEIISTEEQFELDMDNNKNSMNTSSTKQEAIDNGPDNNGNNNTRRRPKELLTEKIAKEKMMEIQKEIKEEKKKRPKNLLFTTGYSSEESLSESDDELTLVK